MGKNLIATAIVSGDLHLCSRNYGAHRDYPKESLEYLRKFTEIAEKNKATHIIGCGDFTYGRFNSLEYRKAVDDELLKQNEITNGNRYELFGNHDKAGYGLTEWGYYLTRGLIKPATYLKLGGVNINMVDYVDLKSETFEESEKTNVSLVENEINVIICHNYLKFKDSPLPRYGTPVELDEFSKWYGVDYIICGHIHGQHLIKGSIVSPDGTRSHEAYVHYPGCAMRPAYNKDGMMTEGQLVVLRIFDDGTMEYDVETFPLWSIEDSFNLETKEKKQKTKEEKEARLNISDIVRDLAEHQSMSLDPIEVINSLQGVDARYKEKAIELLKEALG